MTKAFWRRWITAGFCALAGLLLLIYVMKQNSTQVSDSETTEKASEQDFVWINFSARSKLKGCRNSFQGPSLITDEQGFICSYEEATSNYGCCPRKSNLTKRFDCSLCRANRCCKEFELCVSCCLHPDNLTILKKVREHTVVKQSRLSKEINDTFKLCLFKCRTSSLSVQQENTYRDDTHHHCYGLDPPGDM